MQDSHPVNLIGLRPSKCVMERVERIKKRLETDSTSEVIRRSLELHERLLDADEIEITEGGKRYRILLR